MSHVIGVKVTNANQRGFNSAIKDKNTCRDNHEIAPKFMI